jgi:rRNA-processing protein FCF1
LKAVVYDAAVLIAADRNDRRVWAEHKVLLEAGLVPAVSACVVAQTSRARRQAQLRRLLQGCEVVAFTEEGAHAAGALQGLAKTKDVVDAAVVALAIERGAAVRTGDGADIRRLLQAAGVKLDVFEL